MKFILIGVVLVGGGVSLPGREEEEQCDHSAAAVSGVLPEHSVADVPTGHGGLHQCSHTEGNSSCMTACSDSRNIIKMYFFFKSNVNMANNEWPNVCKLIAFIDVLTIMWLILF